MSRFKAVLLVAISVCLTNVVAVADTVFVTSWGGPGASTGGIYRVDPNIGGLIRIAPDISTGGYDQGVCGPDGRLYFAEIGKRAIIRLTQEGHEMTPVATLPGNSDDWNSAPDGPSFDAQGNLYFTTLAEGSLWYLVGTDPTKQPVQIAPSFGGPTLPGHFIGAATAVLTKGPYAGDVIVSHHAGNVVYRIHPADGQARIFLEKNLSQSFGLAINSQGEIFVGSSDTTTEVGRGWITKFAPDGTYLGQFADLGNTEGDGIAFDSQDNLWVVNANAVFKITPSGQRTLASAVPYEGVGIAICKDSAITSSSQPHFPLELTALWLTLGLYAAGRKVVKPG